MYLRSQSGRLGAPWRQYEERVIARQGGGRYTILLREDPFALSGLRGLGSTPIGPTVVGASAPIAAAAVTLPSVSSALGLGAAAGPIGAGIGVLVGVIAGLWAAHDARAAGAKSENQALNSALTAFDASLRAIFQAANTGQVTGAQAAQACQQTLQSFWSGMAPYTTGPGRADASGGGMNCGTVNPSAPCTGMISGHLCNKSCTATCCVGCQDLAPTIWQAVNVFNSPTGGSITACNVAGSSYGATARGSYTLTYTPPAASTVAGGLSALTSGSLSAPSVGGLPLWAILAGAGLAIYAVAG